MVMRIIMDNDPAINYEYLDVFMAVHLVLWLCSLVFVLQGQRFGATEIQLRVLVQKIHTGLPKIRVIHFSLQQRMEIVMVPYPVPSYHKQIFYRRVVEESQSVRTAVNGFINLVVVHKLSMVNTVVVQRSPLTVFQAYGIGLW